MAAAAQTTTVTTIKKLPPMKEDVSELKMKVQIVINFALIDNYFINQTVLMPNFEK
jgi:hypothetical protein